MPDTRVEHVNQGRCVLSKELNALSLDYINMLEHDKCNLQRITIRFNKVSNRLRLLEEKETTRNQERNFGNFEKGAKLLFVPLLPLIAISLMTAL